MSSRILERFNKEMKRRNVRLRGAVLMQGYEIIDEIYNGTFCRDTKTRMYSTSKSVAAVAIGKLVGEGRLSLDDKVVDIFKDRFDMTDVHPFIKEQTVRQMLTMTTAHSNPTYSPEIRDWLASYFRAVPTHPAGTAWHYDSSGSYVLGAITEHITGLDYVQYLRPEFDVMGISDGVYTLKGPDGEAWASSGFFATTSDLAKIAYLLLRDGVWSGKQLIPKDYARDAISPLVRNDDGATSARFDCGYGYQIWSHPNGAFAFRGLGGQIAIGYPGRDIVFACNSDTSGNHNAYDDIFDAVEALILPEFPIVDRDAEERMQPRRVTETVLDTIDGKRYNIEQSPLHIDSLVFRTEGEGVRLTYTKRGAEYSISFVPGEESQIIFPEKYSGEVLFDRDKFMNYRCSVTSRWLEANKLHIHVWAEDLFVGNMTLCFIFTSDGRITVKADKHAQFFFDDFSGYAWGTAEK